MDVNSLIAFLLCVLDLSVHAAALLHTQPLWALHEDTLSSASDARKLYPQQGAIWPSVFWTDVILLVLQDKGMIQICFGITRRQSYHSHVMVMSGLWTITLSKKKRRYFLRTSNYFSQGSIDLLCWWRENQQIPQLCLLYLFSFAATLNETSRILILTEQKSDLKRSLVLQLRNTLKLFFFS